jgi:hypothetical protein
VRTKESWKIPNSLSIGQTDPRGVYSQTSVDNYWKSKWLKHPKDSCSLLILVPAIYICFPVL